MPKKIILQRNLRKGEGGGPAYLKYLVIAAVCLTCLVIVVPYLIKGKSREVTKRPVPDRGTITKEIPKQAEQSPSAKLPEPAKPGEPLRPSETKPSEPAAAPVAVSLPEVQPALKPLEQSPATSPKAPAAEAPSVQTAKPAEPAPKDLFPKKGAPSEAPMAAVQKEFAKPGSKAGGPTPPIKPTPLIQRGDYAVQVGAIFRDRSQAETVRKDLASKGYKAVIHTAADGCGYSVATSPGPASKAYTLQEQMKIQGLSNTKVIKVTPAPRPARKPAPRGKGD